MKKQIKDVLRHSEIIKRLFNVPQVEFHGARIGAVVPTGLNDLVVCVAPKEGSFMAIRQNQAVIYYTDGTMDVQNVLPDEQLAELKQILEEASDE